MMFSSAVPERFPPFAKQPHFTTLRATERDEVRCQGRDRRGGRGALRALFDAASLGGVIDDRVHGRQTLPQAQPFGNKKDGRVAFIRDSGFGIRDQGDWHWGLGKGDRDALKSES
jgi:hypothetical protein